MSHPDYPYRVDVRELEPYVDGITLQRFMEQACGGTFKQSGTWGFATSGGGYPTHSIFQHQADAQAFIGLVQDWLGFSLQYPLEVEVNRPSSQWRERPTN